jgi:hypothetical protein
LSKEDFKIFQKVNSDPLHSISKNAKVTLIGDSIEQSDFGKVYITSVIDDKCYVRKVIVKVLFQGKENELKNESEMGEIIRKICMMLIKQNWYLIYYFWNAMPSQMQDNGILIQLLISERIVQIL